MNFRLASTTILTAAALFFGLGCTQKKTDGFRILTAGIRHESNSFMPYLTEEEDFITLRSGDVTKDRAWAGYLEDEGVEVIPTLHAISGPSGVVSREAYEAFRDEILEGFEGAGRVDGVLLDMHGALHVEGYPDAQVDFIQRIREIVGEDVLVAASFDLHGNISPEFMEGLNIISAYRTAPHVDGEETRLRTVKLLLEALHHNYQPQVAHINIPVLIPGEKGITSVEPVRTFYERLPEIAGMEGLMDASVFVGMPWTDVHRAGMSVQVVAQDARYMPMARKQAEALANSIWDQRENLRFDVETATIDKAIQFALESTDSTVFITDSGDNVTAGAAGDGTLVLERLLAHRVSSAVLAGIVDPEAVEHCVKAGVGTEVELNVGGKIDYVYSKPLFISGTVISLPKGEPGSEKGDAVLQLEGITLVLLSSHRAFTDPAHFRAVGIDPLSYKIVIVKEGYLFQGLRDIAPRAIMALTPGFANQNLEELDYQQVRRPIFPLDPDLSWTVPAN
ncbi:MAG: M81 family metallopeptidase [Bacteroidales bacterium]|nr:M81 family metallopeptidase [Bacteroidales bacterium]